MFGAVCAADDAPVAALMDVGREFSPRVESYGPPGTTQSRSGKHCISIDLSGVTRLFGDARTLAGEIRRTAADRGLHVRVAIAGTSTAARLLAHAKAGLTVIAPGAEAAAVAPLPLRLLSEVAAADLATLQRWGLRTCGEFAALPPDDVAARLGQEGVAWQRLARGEDPRPLLPAVPDERFEQALDLEWPIDGLEPLAFVLGRLFEPLSEHLARRDRGAAVLHVRLHLVTKDVHVRSLQLPVPMRDARTLRTLVLLDLESHPPAAGIDRVVVAVDPTPARVIQYSLITRPLPTPEQLSTLTVRLTALMGDGRCGSPADVDSWRPGACAVRPFVPEAADTGRENTGRVAVGKKDAAPCMALRRYRFPVPARVRLDAGTPVHVMTDRRGMGGGRVDTASGPWRTSGAWWTGTRDAWDRDEWDVALGDGATYRVFRERATDAWFVDGVVD